VSPPDRLRRRSFRSVPVGHGCFVLRIHSRPQLPQLTSYQTDVLFRRRDRPWLIEIPIGPLTKAIVLPTEIESVPVVNPSDSESRAERCKLGGRSTANVNVMGEAKSVRKKGGEGVHI